MKTFRITENDSQQRVDKFLQKAVPRLPKSLLYKSIRLKKIKLNGKRCEISTRLCVGDTLSLYLNDEFFEPLTQDTAFYSAPVQLEVVYEDENLLLVNKPAGLVVHESDDEAVDTLINRIQHYLFQKGEYQPVQENSFRPALCNRIDRNTSGIVIAAKNAATLRVMNQKIKDRELKKLYLCILHGTLERKSGTLTGYLRKDSEKNQVTIYSSARPGAKTILTKYRILEETRSFSLAQVELLTGRTHQIRAHFAWIGHPLLGDTKYGTSRQNQATGHHFQALCAYKLVFEFTTDAEHLEYLNHHEFQIDTEDFYEQFFRLP